MATAFQEDAYQTDTLAWQIESGDAGSDVDLCRRKRPDMADTRFLAFSMADARVGKPDASDSRLSSTGIADERVGRPDGTDERRGRKDRSCD